MFAAILSGVVGIVTDGLAEGWYESGAIFLAIVIITVVTVGCNYHQNEQFKKLHMKSVNEDFEVTRAGKKLYIDQDLLLTGDILSIKTGMI